MAENQTNIGLVRGVSVGSWGQTIIVTLQDLSGVVQNVSTYTGTKSAVAISPDGAKRVSATVSFSTDGSDGLVQWTWASGDIDRPGNWTLQISLNKTTARIKTFIAKMPVIAGLAED